MRLTVGSATNQTTFAQMEAEGQGTGYEAESQHTHTEQVEPLSGRFRCAQSTSAYIIDMHFSLSGGGTETATP